MRTYSIWTHTTPDGYGIWFRWNHSATVNIFTGLGDAEYGDWPEDAVEIGVFTIYGEDGGPATMAEVSKAVDEYIYNEYS